MAHRPDRASPAPFVPLALAAAVLALAAPARAQWPQQGGGAQQGGGMQQGAGGPAQAGGGQAGGPKRVVVEPFGGPQGGGLRTLLVRNLSEQPGIELVPRDEMERTARDLGFNPRRMREEQYAAVAQELNVAAFIDGRVMRRRRRWALTVRVRNGADGTRIASEGWGGRTVGALRGIRRNGHARLADHLAIAQAPAAPEPEPTPPPQPVQGQAAWYQQTETPPEGEEQDEQDEEPAPRNRRYSAFEVGFVMGALGRNMSTTAQVLQCMRAGSIAPDCNQDSTPIVAEPRAYDSSGLGHLELGFEAELYPGAIPEEQPVPWLGAVVSYRNAVGLDTTGPPCTGRDGRSCPADQVNVGTTQRDVLIGARGRYRFWLGERALGIRATLGWGNFAFELQEKDLQLLARERIVPPIDYKYVQIGFGATVDLVPVYLSFGLDFGGRLGLEVGDAAKRIWGAGTTSAGGWILSLELRSEAPYVVEGAFFGLQLDYLRFSTDFQGQTLCIDGTTDCGAQGLWEPWPVQDGQVVGLPDTVEDNYLRLGLVLGYAFTP